MISKFIPNKASRYIIIEFIKMFLLIVFSTFLIIFVVNFLEFSGEIQRYSIPPIDTLKIIIYKIPSILEVILIFIVVLSVVFTLMKLYSRNELTILYSSGLSPWNVLTTFACTSFMIGVLNITLFNMFSVTLYEKAEMLLLFLKDKDIEMSYINPRSGVWLNLKNNITNDELIIRSADVITEKLSFNNTTIIVYDTKGDFIKKIQANRMRLTNDSILLFEVFTSGINKMIKKNKELIIPININEDFIKKQLQNKYANLNMIPFLRLDNLVATYKLLNFDIHKFVVKKYNFIIVPFIYIFLVSMTFIILEDNQRNTKNLLCVANIIIISIMVYLLQSTILELSLAKKVDSRSVLYFIVILYVTVYCKLIKKIEL